MQLIYVLELLKPTKRKQNIFLKNIAEVVKNCQTILLLLIRYGPGISPG